MLVQCMRLKKIGKVFMSKFVVTGPSSYKKKNLPGHSLAKVEKHCFRGPHWQIKHSCAYLTQTVSQLKIYEQYHRIYVQECLVGTTLSGFFHRVRKHPLCEILSVHLFACNLMLVPTLVETSKPFMGKSNFQSH